MTLITWAEPDKVAGGGEGVSGLGRSRDASAMCRVLDRDLPLTALENGAPRHHDFCQPTGWPRTYRPTHERRTEAK